MQETIDNVINFNPLDAPNNFVNVDWIKRDKETDHRYQFNKRDKLELQVINDPKERWAREKEMRERVSALVVETYSGQVKFIYGSRTQLDKSLERFKEERIKVLKQYLGVSLESFCKAEKIYRKTKSVEAVESFLTY